MMGDKAAARKAMTAVGVPVVPGTPGPVEDVDEALGFAKKIGFPVIIKAAAGGGGKGMRVALDADDFARAFQLARSEALQAFGNGDVYVEKYLQRPRHIEFQILGDKHGNVIHLGERDCSVQRRHQKLIEESPSPAMTPELREKMGNDAVRGAKAIDYVGAGTIEMLLDEDGSYYFMEMNTRIQVEHPVTEMLTGVDLVKEQIRVASGEKLCDQGAAAAARARDRMPRERRGSGAEFPAVARAHRRVPSAGRAGRAHRHARLRRLHRAAVLRLAAREGHLPGARPRRGGEADAGGARELRARRGDDDHPVPRARDAEPALPVAGRSTRNSSSARAT